MTKKKDKYKELAGEFKTEDELEEELDEEGVTLKDAEEQHFEESDKK